MRWAVSYSQIVYELACAMHKNLPKLEHPLMESLDFLLNDLKSKKNYSIQLYYQYLHHSAICQHLQRDIDRLRSALASTELANEFAGVLQIIESLYELESEEFDYEYFVLCTLSRYRAALAMPRVKMFLFSEPQSSVDFTYDWCCSSPPQMVRVSTVSK